MVTSSATSRTRCLNCTSMRCKGVNSRLHMCDLVSNRTELHIDSLLKRGCGNHCLGRLSSCGARHKNFATPFVPMALPLGHGHPLSVETTAAGHVPPRHTLCAATRPLHARVPSLCRLWHAIMWTATTAAQAAGAAKRTTAPPVAQARADGRWR